MIETTDSIMTAPLPLEEPSQEAGSQPSAVAPLVIEPEHGWRLINARELWRSRELLYFLALRDIKVRYKQTALGAAWAVLQPFMMMVVFTIFLGRMAGVSAGDAPYPLFVYAGLLPWTFFSTAVANAGNSVVGSERLITKIYFPRLAIPFASVGAALADFCVAFLMLAAMMLWYGVRPTAGLLLVPVVAAMLLTAAAGVGTLLAALNVSYRDFRYVVPFLMQMWMFATPSIYMDTSASARADAQTVASIETHDRTTAEAAPAKSRSANVPAWAKGALKLNPLTGLVRVFRAAVLGGAIDWSDLSYAAALSAVMFLAGCTYFRRVEDGFADVI